MLFPGVPRIAVIAVLILALVGALWFWKRWRSSSMDHETEDVKAARNAAMYAETIARRAEYEQTPAVTDEYTTEIAHGLQYEHDADKEDDSAEDMEDMEDVEDIMDDDEYEPME